MADPGAGAAWGTAGSDACGDGAAGTGWRQEPGGEGEDNGCFQACTAPLTGYFQCKYLPDWGEKLF